MNTAISNTSQKKQQVLVIENNASNIETLRSMLCRDFRVIVVRNADEAIACIRSSAEEISLIMLDIQTMGPDGVQLLNTLKSDPAMSRLPVIILTKEKAFEAHFLQIGASDVIQLPCDLPDIVLARVRRSIRDIRDSADAQNNTVDKLTGILKPDSFFRHADEYDKQHPDVPMDALRVDISGFYAINDLYGRDEGNKILVALAQELGRIAAEHNGIAGRKTADVFLLYIPHQDAYEGILERLQTPLAALLTDQSDTIRLKMGVYPNVDKSIAIETRFDKAKRARDTARGSYSQSIAYYDGEKYRENLVAQQLMREMDASLENHDFIVYYQPKYSIRGDEFVVILRGRDYDNRGELLDILRESNRKNIAHGGAVIAFGMAEYNPSSDRSPDMVFARADVAMYAEKKSLKKRNR